MKFLGEHLVFHISILIVLLPKIKTMKHGHKLMSMREIKIDLVFSIWKSPDQVFQIQQVFH
jgi:hypothetical protein